MTDEMIRNILFKIKENKLEKYFKTPIELENWLLNLNIEQKTNFLLLEITPEILESIPSVILDPYVLSKRDFLKRIDAISKIKTKDTTFYLLEEVLKNPNFIDNDKYYWDIEMISKANNLKYILTPLNNVDFLNSKYHKQDLELILNMVNKDINNENKKVCDALAETASNSDSLKSRYHEEDMNIIKNANNNVVKYLEELATSPISLNDEYHQENMYIVNDYQEISELLTNIMTDSSIVNSKSYRKEVYELCNVKSISNAIALYYYIYNPQDKYWGNNNINIRKVLADYRDNYEKEFMQKSIGTCMIEDNALYQDYSLKQKYVNLKHNKDYNYLEGLKIIKKTPDDRVFHIVSLLMNPLFYKNKSCKEAIEILLKANPIAFNYLYECINCRDFLNKANCIYAANLISQTKSKDKMSFIEWLIKDNNKQKNPNLIYDLNLIFNMDDNDCTNNNKNVKLLEFMTSDKSNLDEHKKKINKILNSNEEVKSELELYIDKILNINSPNYLINNHSSDSVPSPKCKRRRLNILNKNK